MKLFLTCFYMYFYIYKFYTGGLIIKALLSVFVLINVL